MRMQTKYDQNSGNDDNDNQGEATENECENLANVLQNNVSLSFENVEGRSEEEKIMIKNIIEIAEHNLEEEVNGFKKVDRNLLKDWTMKINAILKGIKSENITETNRLIRACAIFVGRKVGLKPKQRRGNPVKEPWWKRRTQQSIQELRKHINILERKKRGEIKKKEKYKVIEHKYRVKKKGLNVVLEELKQRMQAKATKIKRYDQRIEQYRINRLFQQDKKRVYQQLNGKSESSKNPDTEESRRFWSNIWGTEKSHNKNAEWLKELRAEQNKTKQGNIQITTEMVTQQTRQVPNWKCQGSDGVQGYWLKNFAALHERIATKINDMINNGMDIPKWMITGKTMLCQKDPGK